MDQARNRRDGYGIAGRGGDSIAGLDCGDSTAGLDCRDSAGRGGDGIVARGGFPTVVRQGFTIVEILLALLLLSFTVMGFQAATGEIIHFAAQSDRQAVAMQLVEDRLDLIRLDPGYGALETRYETAPTALQDFPGLTRATEIVRTREQQATGVLDYLTITVTVAGSGLREPVARTVVVGAP